jgi:hypothetical protein
MSPEGKKEKRKIEKEKEKAHTYVASRSFPCGNHTRRKSGLPLGDSLGGKKSRFPLIPRRTSTLGLISTPVVDSDSLQLSIRGVDIRYRTRMALVLLRQACGNQKRARGRTHERKETARRETGEGEGDLGA